MCHYCSWKLVLPGFRHSSFCSFVPSIYSSWMTEMTTNPDLGKTWNWTAEMCLKERRWANGLVKSPGIQ